MIGYILKNFMAGSVSHRVVVVPGKELKPFYLEPFTYELRHLGYDAETVKLGTGDDDTFDDDAAAIVRCAGESQLFHVVTHSRGIEGGTRVARALTENGLTSRLGSLTIFNSGGLHGWRLDGETKEQAEQARYTERAQRILKVIDRNNPKLIVAFFGVNDRLQESMLLSSLGEERSLITSAAPLPGETDVPIKVFQGDDDSVLNLERAERVFQENFGISPIVQRGGHLLPLEDPALCAKLTHRHISSVSN